MECYVNGRVFTGDAERPWAEAFAVRGEYIAAVGGTGEVRRYAGAEAREIDLAGALVLPGFVDGHAHVVMCGEALSQADLTGASDLDEIRGLVGAWAHEHPAAPRVRGRGWSFSAVPDGTPHRAVLDEVLADRPVYLDAADYHSMWLNTAALEELGITAATPDPVGGQIVRDPETGEPTGHLQETAAMAVRDRLAELTSESERDSALATAVHAYLSSGVTCAVDMALDERALAAMVRAEQAGNLDLRVVAHWLVPRSGSTEEELAHVRSAAELARTYRSDHLRVTGVKFVVDGVIDGCTAAMTRPYADGSNAEAIWPYEALAPVVAAADAEGLQIALHAIGDGAVRTALDALEHAREVNGPSRHRHRIEHLEYVDPSDVGRLAELGVTASMQPVHADPSIMENWRAMLGDERVDRGFAWPEMTASGARLAFGTDAPTAPHAPLPNMYIASTRRSAADPELPAFLPHYALPLDESIVHGTRDSAWACHAEERFGTLRAGVLADFVVVDSDTFGRPPESLLRARVMRTVVGGRTVRLTE
ncbi:amidohydrolase [Haloechinothrix sp. YIM 98757]|uniref:Amidohydrolase n=1 Tax=Haloechinothrix aidingensis TaxID=2752311 RepID=A0A838ABJ4_9PSEU|nr:amidohydrolase [Haloechinothrix aidingensis]